MFVNRFNPGIIAFIYMYNSLFLGNVGLSLSWWIRFNLSSSRTSFHQIYNSRLTYHGVVMILYYLIPSIYSTIINWSFIYLNCIIDFEYPRSNSISFHFFIDSSVPLIYSNFIYPLNTGWTFYPPLSISQISYSIEVIFLRIHLNRISSILGSYNVIITSITFGLGLLDSSVFSIISSSILIIISIPSFILATLLVILSRKYNLHLIPQLYIHLFWWFGHPEVYVVALPRFGVISRSINSYTDLRGYWSLIYALMRISFLGSSVWAHHMFIDIDWDSRAFFSFMSILVGLPTGVKVFAWNYNVIGLNFMMFLDFPLLVSILFISIFSFGGFSGLIISLSGVNYFFHDSYFVVAHFHFVISLSSTISLVLGGHNCLHFISKWTKVSPFITREIVIICIFSSSTFFVQHLLGLYSLPRRYCSHSLYYFSLNRYSTTWARGNTFSVFILVWETSTNTMLGGGYEEMLLREPAKGPSIRWGQRGE